MKKYSLALLFISLISLSSCEFFQNCVEAEGKVVMNELDLTEINSIVLSSAANVTLTKGSKQLIEVNAPQNYFDLINKEVKNGKWEISFDKCLKQAEAVNIFIAVDDLKEIELSGSGNIMGEGWFHGEELELDINGSGMIQLDVDYKEIDLGIQGSGDITLAGKCKELQLSINGSGDINAENLISDKCSISINGSGDARVNATHELYITVNGSGDVFYKGQPREIDSKLNGSGELKQID